MSEREVVRRVFCVEMGEFVELLRSTRGKYPIASYRLTEQQRYTFCYVGHGRKNKEQLYYSCIQCKSVDSKSKGCKQIHLRGTAVTNGNPSIGHKEGCKSLKTSSVHTEQFKRKASREVALGISTVANAQLNNLNDMVATCEQEGVDINECRRNWLALRLSMK
jgi:hypothetical protein